MEFKIGDKVKFLNDVGGGVIKSIAGNVVFVLDDSGFEYPMATNELLKIDRGFEKAFEQEDPVSGYVDKGISDKNLSAKRKLFREKYQTEEIGGVVSGDTMVVDLHIHELLDSNRGLSNHEMVKIQMDHFERMMKRAEDKKISKIIFIHGVGQGVLKNEIRQALNYFPQASFHDASYQRYGYGATEVILRFN